MGGTWCSCGGMQQGELVMMNTQDAVHEPDAAERRSEL